MTTLNRMLCPIIAMVAIVAVAAPVVAQRGGDGGRQGGQDAPALADDAELLNRSVADDVAAAKKKAAEKTPIPRTKDGKPDFTGRWNPIGLANLNILEEHLGGFGVLAGPTMIVDPPDGKIPYLPAALAERDRRRRPENHWEDNRFKCIFMGNPRNMLFGFTVMQTPEYFVRAAGERAGTVITHMTGAHETPASVKLWMGDSIGHWEGDTLVVDTTNLNGEFWLAIGGDFMSDAAHVVERLTMLNADTLDWEARITDPKAFSRPWTMKYQGPWVRARMAPNDFDDEDSCHEGNVDAVHFYNNREQFLKGLQK